MAKNTYGTGCFLLMNTGPAAMQSQHHLLATVAWRLGAGELQYALEGSVFVGGAAVQWLRDGLGVIPDSGAVEALARRVPDTDGVHFVPAFTGPRRALLGPAGTRRAGRPDARDFRGAYRARRPGGHRLPEHRCAATPCRPIPAAP